MAILIKSPRDLTGETVYWIERRKGYGSHCVLHSVHKGVFVDYNGIQYREDEYNVTWKAWRQGVPTILECNEAAWDKR